MNNLTQPILHFLRSRLARNIYMWIVIFYIVLNNDVENRTYAPGIYVLGVIITSTIIATLTYLNNLLLIPKFLAQKRIGIYVVTIVTSLGVFSVLFIVALKLIVRYYPHMLIHQVSLISTPISTDWSLSAILDEIGMFVFGFSLWLFTMTMAWFMNDYAHQKNLAEEAQKKQVETELHFLKSQVNPHFLFNTMNNLYALALKKSDKGPDAILRLSSILRYLLYDSNVDNIPIEKEMEIMKAYIDLELLRLPSQNDFRFTIEVDGNYNISPLLWLPILENIFKHGTGVISNSYFIEYSFVIKNDVLNIHSKNNYKPATGNGLIKAGGIGMGNLKKRLSLLYPDAHRLNFEKDEAYYIVDLEIKLS